MSSGTASLPARAAWIESPWHHFGRGGRGGRALREARGLKHRDLAASDWASRTTLDAPANPTIRAKLNLVTRELHRALEAGATVLTPSARLAARIREEYGEAQAAAGRTVWNSPDVRPWPAFLDDCWRGWLYGASAHVAPLRLNSDQAAPVWERAIPNSGDWPLLDVPGTAARAARAWALAHQYSLPLRGGVFAAHDDSRAFLGWAREYDQRSRDEGWLDDATLPDYLLGRFAAGEIARPRSAFYTGFDTLTPLEKDWFHDALDARPIESPTHGAAPRLLSFANAGEEAHGMAVWARAALSRNPRARIGVVVPDLDARRLEIEHALRGALHPRPFDGADAAFHVSLGPPLADAPPVRAALPLLSLAFSPVAAEEAGALLRSPFLSGASGERTARAALDIKLRAAGRLNVSLSDIIRRAGNCPALRDAFSAFDRARAALPAEARPSEWAATFARLLAEGGWPGAGLTSGEFQAIDAWRRLFTRFASLDATLGRIGGPPALDRLRRMARQQPFQVENVGAPVQVMGALESAGLDFDALWVMGVDGRAFPAPLSPDPFLPLDLQRAHGLPRASETREIAFATLLLRRLEGSAPEVVFSYALQEDDRAIRPSALVPGVWAEGGIARRAFAAAPLEPAAADRGPAVGEGPRKGGSAVLRDMALCPFRAFAAHRLACEPLEEAGAAIAPRDHGIAIHKALEMFWAETGSFVSLHALGVEAREERIERSVNAALAHLTGHLLAEVERERLRALLRAWLDLEMRRAPFTVVERERRGEIEIGGLRLDVRADRVDQLADGRRLLIDYKTGRIESGVWLGARPSEPQLPLYAVTAGVPPDGVAFAQVRAGEMKFLGAIERGALPEIDPQRIDAASLALQLPLWRTVLEDLAQRFASGDAAVDPAPKACEHCPYPSLCRVHETGAMPNEEDADDAG